MSLFTDSRECFDHLKNKNNKENSLGEYSKVIEDGFDIAQIFRVDESIINLLINTDSKEKYIPGPFRIFFIESEIPINKTFKLSGLLVFSLGTDLDGVNSSYELLVKKWDGMYNIFFHVKEFVEGKWINHFSGISYPSYFSHEGDREDLYESDSKKWDVDIKNIESQLDSEEFRYKIGNFVVSFLNFLNNPEIELNHREFSDKRVRKYFIKNGNIKNKKDYYVKITGKIKKYCDDFNSDIENSANILRVNSWIVRGHFRSLSNKIFKNKIGQKTWISPYVKGMGEIKKKTYLVSQKKKIYYNQFLMEEIIKSIFRDNFVLSNTRAFLDGLEIDCYIPSIKLGFEYDGEQHYIYPNAYHKTKQDFLNQQLRDIKKRDLAKKRGITIITIRYDEELSEDLIRNKILEIGYV